MLMTGNQFILTLIIVMLIIIPFCMRLNSFDNNLSNDFVNFKKIDNRLIISSIKFIGKYEIYIPENIKIEESDKISITYLKNSFKIGKILELYVNDKIELIEKTHNFSLKIVSR